LGRRIPAGGEGKRGDEKKRKGVIFILETLR